MFQRAVLHLDLDAFFASVECRQNDALRGRPLLIGSVSGRSVVSSCSYEARQFGIHAGMPMQVALLRCPEATVVRGDFELYQKASASVTSIIAEESPLFEKASIDEFYIDLTGLDRYVGCWLWSQKLRQRILDEIGLPISVGLACNKLVSKVSATEAKPNGEYCVENGTEKVFLAPLPVRRLPSIGPLTARRLSFMGVRTIEKLSHISPVLLRQEFGKHGLDIWRKANAQDDSPIVPYYDKKSTSTEHTFAADTIDMNQLHAELGRMVMSLSYELRQSKRVTACISVKIRYSDYSTYNRQLRIAPTANDSTLVAHAHQLFKKLFHRRQRIRLVGVRLSKLSHGYSQLNLFEDHPKEGQLLQTMDGIRKRFGKHILEKW